MILVANYKAYEKGCQRTRQGYNDLLVDIDTLAVK